MSAYPLHFSRSRGVVRRTSLTPQFGEYYRPFMIWKDRVVILPIAHAKRRPYYWRQRMGEAKTYFNGRRFSRAGGQKKRRGTGEGPRA